MHTPSCYSGGVLYSLRISLQSLEAIGCSATKSAGRISLSCMHVACRFIGGSAHCTFPSIQIPAPTVPNCSLNSSQLLGVLIIQTAPSSVYSTRWDKSAPNFPIPSGCLFLLLFSSNIPAFPHFLFACNELQNQIVASTSQNAATTVLHLQSPFVSHFLGDTALNSEYSLHLQASLHSMYKPQYTYGSQQAGRQTQSHTQMHTRRHTTLQSSDNPKACLLSTEQSRWCTLSVPSTMTNLTHYRLTSMLMTTSGSSPNPAHWYPSCNPPKAVTLVRMVPMSPQCQPVPVVTPSRLQDLTQ